MNVTLYSRAFPPAVGGMERYAEELATWMSGRGHSVTVVTHTQALSNADKQKPYRVIRDRNPLRARQVMAAADVVHVNGLSLRGIVLSSLARRSPLVTHAGYQAICPVGLGWAVSGQCTVTPRNSGRCDVCPLQGIAGRARVRLHRAGARTAARNVCVSHYLEERTRVPRSVTVYNPVASRTFEADVGAESDGDGILFVGRLVAEKGLDLLLGSLALLPSIKLRVAGDGPMRSRWQGLASELGVAARTEFLGARSLTELAGLVGEAVVVCVPSLWPEPFGYTAAEAMAMGRAVVATPSGALPELLADGRGFVAEEPSTGAFAAKLREALDDASCRREVESRARNFAFENLSLDSVGPRYEALYEAAKS